MGGTAGYDSDSQGNTHSGNTHNGDGHNHDGADSENAERPISGSKPTASVKPERRRKRPPGLFRMIWRQSGMERVQRILGLILGLIIIILGVLIAPLPGPFGLPIAVLGLVVALRSSYWARRVFVRFRRKYPRIGGYLRAMLRKRARFGVIMWSMMLRSEHLARRLFGGGRPVFLPSIRHKWFRARRKAKWLPLSRLASGDPIAVAHLAVTAVPLQVLDQDPPNPGAETLSVTHFPMPIPLPDPAKTSETSPGAPDDVAVPGTGLGQSRRGEGQNE